MLNERYKKILKEQFIYFFKMYIAIPACIGTPILLRKVACLRVGTEMRSENFLSEIVPAYLIPLVFFFYFVRSESTLLHSHITHRRETRIKQLRIYAILILIAQMFFFVTPKEDIRAHDTGLIEYYRQLGDNSPRRENEGRRLFSGGDSAPWLYLLNEVELLALPRIRTCKNGLY